MSNATVSSSVKTQAGTLHSVGGAGYDDYYMNLTALFGGDTQAVEDVLTDFKNLLRPIGGGYAYGTSSPSPRTDDAPREGAGAPPGAATLCPTHNLPAVWREGGIAKGSGKPYLGFWKCASTGESISEYNGPGLRTSCPPRKQQ